MLSKLVFLLIATAAVWFVGFIIYIRIKYTPKIAKIFQFPPIFQPERCNPIAEAENVSFSTEDGLVLEGSLLKARAAPGWAWWSFATSFWATVGPLLNTPTNCEVLASTSSASIFGTMGQAPPSLNTSRCSG